MRSQVGDQPCDLVDQERGPEAVFPVGAVVLAPAVMDDREQGYYKLIGSRRLRDADPVLEDSAPVA